MYDSWQRRFFESIDLALVPGARVLDVGGGRAPTLLAHQRQLCGAYVGLDPLANELALAGPDAYTDRVTGDVTLHQPELDGAFDLIVSWQVLEHVRPLDVGIRNMRNYLRPGGQMVVFFSGRFSVFGLINLVLPRHIGHRAVARVMRRDLDTVFPAYYHRCHPGALRPMLAEWSSYDIEPHWGGAGYFRFSAALQRAYLAYERTAQQHGWESLATHFLVRAVR